MAYKEIIVETPYGSASVSINVCDQCELTVLAGRTCQEGWLRIESKAARTWRGETTSFVKASIKAFHGKEFCSPDCLAKFAVAKAATKEVR